MFLAALLEQLVIGDAEGRQSRSPGLFASVIEVPAISGTHLL